MEVVSLIFVVILFVVMRMYNSKLEEQYGIVNELKLDIMKITGDKFLLETESLAEINRKLNLFKVDEDSLATDLDRIESYCRASDKTKIFFIKLMAHLMIQDEISLDKIIVHKCKSYKELAIRINSHYNGSYPLSKEELLGYMLSIVLYDR